MRKAFNPKSRNKISQTLKSKFELFSGDRIESIGPEESVRQRFELPI